MDEDKSKKTDLDIASEFDRLFDEIPEPNTDGEVRAYLEETGYDVEKLKTEGVAICQRANRAQEDGFKAHQPQKNYHIENWSALNLIGGAERLADADHNHLITAIKRTCVVCTLYDQACEKICKDCPLADLVRQLAVSVETAAEK
jgi:hypothetical protein